LKEGEGTGGRGNGKNNVELRGKDEGGRGTARKRREGDRG
jgi:hypothetical protein